MELFKKFVKRIDDDFGYDNEKLARDLQKIAEEHQALQLQQTGVMACCSKKKKEYKDYLGQEFIYKSKITRAETWFKVIAHFERAGRTILISENNNGYYLDEVCPYNKP